MNYTGNDMWDANAQSYIKNIELADSGETQIQFALESMPVLSVITGRFDILQPFKGKRIAVCTHITKESAIACLALKSGGGEIVLASSNPISTQDNVAAALVKYHGITVCGTSDLTEDKWKECLEKIFQFKPDIILDEGSEILSKLYERHPDYAERLIGTTEQTTSGVNKAHNMEKAGILKHPIIAVNSSQIKHMFDNYFGVGQTALTTVAQTSNLLVSAETVVVIGYGYVGKGIAAKAKGLGAHVIVCEIDPLKALNAYLEGYSVMNIQEASKIGTVFITATGSSDVIPIDAIMNMKAGAVLSNCGSGQKEIDVASLKERAVSTREIRQHLVRYYLPNGRYVHLLTDGRVTNIVAGGGNPSIIMDLSFSAIVLGVEYLLKEKLENRVYTMPVEIDEAIAQIKMNEFEINVSKPTEKQKKFDLDWHK